MPHEVDLPAGGSISLLSSDEVVLWNDSARRYIDDFGLRKANDLVLLGAVLSQQVVMYRAQTDMQDPKKSGPAQNVLIKAATEIRDLEKALGIDKKTREAGGQHTVADYVTRLKQAANAKGVHISDRVKAYESFCMELRWKVRLLENGDVEDKQYHDLTPQKVIAWVRNELAALEEKDKEWAKQKGAVFVGRL